MAERYEDYLASAHWQEMRQRKLEAAAWKCERCGELHHRTYPGVPGILQVHHLSYERIGCEELADLEVLCEPCHEKEHGISDGGEHRRAEIRRNRSTSISGLTTGYTPDEIDQEIEAWDVIAEQADV